MKKNEIYKEEGENLASKVPTEIAQTFRQQAKVRANLKKFLAAAAHLWTCFPPELQMYIMKNQNKKDLYKILVNWIRDDEVSKYLASLPESEKNEILAKKDTK